MARYSGIYLHYEGTTAQCNAVQEVRETVFDTTSGLMRYKDLSSGIHYFADATGVGAGYWEAESQGIYYPVSSSGFARVGPDGTTSGVQIGYTPAGYDTGSSSPNGLVLVSSPIATGFENANGNDMIGGRQLWICGHSGLYLNSLNGDTTLTSDDGNTYINANSIIQLGFTQTISGHANRIDWKANSYLGLSSTEVNINAYGASSSDIVMTADGTISGHSQGDLWLGTSGVNSDFRIQSTGEGGWISLSGYRIRMDATGGTSNLHMFCTSLIDILGEDEVIISGGASITLKSDIVQSDWTTYTPSTSGFSSVTHNDCSYYRLGRMYFITVSISGVGNGDPTTFDVPAAPTSYDLIGQKILTGYAIGVGWYPTVDASVAIPQNMSQAQVMDGDTAYAEPIVGSVIGSGEHKWICGAFWYHAA